MKMKTRMKFAVVLLSIGALSIGGCGWDVDGADRMNELYPKSDDGQPQDVIEDGGEEDVSNPDATGDDTQDDVVGTDANVWPDVSYEGIEGRWAGRLVSRGKMAPIGDPVDMSTSDLFLAQGTEGNLTLTFCDEIIDVNPNEMFSTSTVTKQALRDAIAATPIELTATAGGIDAQKIVWRWALAASIGDDDDFPEEVTLENYPDIDEDTFEGVTMSVSVVAFGSPTSGERYMAKRVKFDLAAGQMSGDGRWITGAMTYVVDEKVLGASVAMLEMGATITPETEGTLYQFRRVDDQFDCAALVAGHETLFQGAP